MGSRSQAVDYSVGITAGGRSSRFGSDKRFALIGEKSFLDNAIERFSSSPELILSVDSYLESYSKHKQVVDSISGIGPIEAIRQILTASGRDYSFIISVDMPFIRKDFADYLASLVDVGTDCVCPVVEGRLQPLCAIYSKSAVVEIEKMIPKGDYRIQNLLNRINTKKVEKPISRFSPDCFLNINTPEDYRKIVDMKKS